MRHCAKIMDRGAKNLHHGAKNVCHGAKIWLYGAKKCVSHCGQNRIQPMRFDTKGFLVDSFIG